MTDSYLKEIDLSAVKDPVFRIKLADGTTIDHDPFALVEKLGDIDDSESPQSIVSSAIDSVKDGIDPQPKKKSMFSTAREIFGVPSLTSHQCLHLLYHLRRAISEAEVTRNMEKMEAEEAKKRKQ